MNKTFFKNMVLAALMTLPVLAKAQTTFAGITAEQNAQNTPEGWTAVELPQMPAITSENTFNITNYGASTSAADNTKAIQKALDAVPTTGGMVVIPPGTWMFGSTDQMTSTTEVLSINSKTVLHLCKGATLKLVEYGKAPNNKTLFIGCKNRKQNDIIIEGEGETSIIDGQGARWWKARDNKETFNPGAMIRFEQGSRFMVRNIKIQNTPGVNLTISNSGKASHATIHDVTIYNPASDTKTEQPSHNTDGISIWGHHVNIYDCNISTGDDNVVCDDNAQYVHVWNCKMGTGHGASFGSFTNNMHDIIYENLTFKNTDSGFRLKSQRDRSGDVYNLIFRNCTMTGVRNPIYIETWYNLSTKPIPSEATAAEVTPKTPAFRDILIQNVTSTGTPYNTSAKGYFPIYIYGLPESYVKNITFDNVQVEAQKGMFLAFVDGITFKNGCKITNSKDGKLIATQYEVNNLTGDYTGSSTVDPTPGETGDVTYTLAANTCSLSNGSTETTWNFKNGCSITSNKGYATAKSNTIKYSKGVKFTINLPQNVTITSATFAGYANEDNKNCYLSELDGVNYTSDKYSFPSRTTTTSTDTSYDITLATPATGVMTFTPQDAQAAWVITLKGTKVTSAITNITTDTKLMADTNIYDLSGRVVAQKGFEGLKKGIYIFNNKKFVVK
jgi:polygalacturonase